MPTDIFWGEDDGMTPVSDAHVMHKEISGSTLHLYKGVRHRVHRDKAREIGKLIQSVRSTNACLLVAVGRLLYGTTPY